VHLDVQRKLLIVSGYRCIQFGQNLSPNDKSVFVH
jgi:hypothetical protein